MQKMECFILFALFTFLDCVSTNNQCGANSMGGRALKNLRFKGMSKSALQPVIPCAIRNRLPQFIYHRKGNNC